MEQWDISRPSTPDKRRRGKAKGDKDILKELEVELVRMNPEDHTTQRSHLKQATSGKNTCLSEM